METPTFATASPLIGTLLVAPMSGLLKHDTLISAATAPVTWLTLLVGWAALCRTLRYRREKQMLRKYGYTGRESLARMTNVQAQEILQTLAETEFPWMSTLALQFALFKTYCFEYTSALLVQTKQLSHDDFVSKRYEDTALLFSEFMLNPPTSERHRKAIARVNCLHRPYIQAGKIVLQDLVYTFAVSIVEPVRFYGLYEWRQPNDMEIAAIAQTWKCIADGMAIDYAGLLGKSEWRDGLEFYEDVRAWAHRHEVEMMRPCDANAKLGKALLEMMVFHYPGYLKQFVREALWTLMGVRVKDAFRFPEPGILPAAVVYTLLSVRRFVVRHLFLPRFTPFKNTSEPNSRTGRIQHLTYLRYPYYTPPTFLYRWGPAALWTRLMGGVVPSAGEHKFMPDGFLFAEVGPEYSKNRGVEEMQKDEDWLADPARNCGGCPFVVT